MFWLVVNRASRQEWRGLSCFHIVDYFCDAPVSQLISVTSLLWNHLASCHSSLGCGCATPLRAVAVAVGPCSSVSRPCSCLHSIETVALSGVRAVVARSVAVAAVVDFTAISEVTIPVATVVVVVAARAVAARAVAVAGVYFTTVSKVAITVATIVLAAITVVVAIVTVVVILSVVVATVVVAV